MSKDVANRTKVFSPLLFEKRLESCPCALEEDGLIVLPVSHSGQCREPSQLGQRYYTFPSTKSRAQQPRVWGPGWRRWDRSSSASHPASCVSRSARIGRRLNLHAEAPIPKKARAVRASAAPGLRLNWHLLVLTPSKLLTYDGGLGSLATAAAAERMSMVGEVLLSALTQVIRAIWNSSTYRRADPSSSRDRPAQLALGPRAHQAH